MSGSQAVRPAGIGAVAFGLALLFAAGGFGFYLLAGIVPSSPSHPASRPAPAPDEQREPRAPAALPAVPNAADPEPAPALPTDPSEAVPTAITTVPPER